MLHHKRQTHQEVGYWPGQASPPSEACDKPFPVGCDYDRFSSPQPGTEKAACSCAMIAGVQGSDWNV